MPIAEKPSLLGNVVGILEAVCYTVKYLGLDFLAVRRVRQAVNQRLPASPYLTFRLLRDPPGRYDTGDGRYLLLMPRVPKPVLVEYVIEEHVTPRNQREALTLSQLKNLRAGQPGVRVHWDLRWRDPETGEVHAVVLSPRKDQDLPRFPAPKERQQVIKVDDKHGHELLKNVGTKHRNRVIIEEGYGRGHSRVIKEGKTFIWSGQDIDGIPSFHIWIPGEGGFAIISPKEWRNGTPRNYLMFRLKQDDIPHFDRPWRVKDLSSRPEDLEFYLDSPDWVAETKYDGAFYTIVVEGRKNHDYATVKVISRRSKHVQGEPTHMGIDKAYNLIHVKFADWPAWAYGKKIYVEVHSTSKGQWASEHGRSTAILNSDPATAFAEQEKHGRLKVTILGVEGGDYRQQRELAEALAREVKYQGDPVFSLPETGRMKAGKLTLIDKQRKANGEGVVFKNLEGETTIVKYPFKGATVDMRIVGVELMDIKATSTQAKFQDQVPAQRFKVEDPNGRTWYVVIRDPEGGPGSTEQLKLDAGANPDKYIGGYVEVRPRRTNRVQAGDIVRVRFDKD